MTRTATLLAAIVAAVIALPDAAAGRAQRAGAPGRFHESLDTLLDLYVRDGLVYYNAVRSERRRLDAYVASLDGPAARDVERWPRPAQVAFWLNAYNALVLRTVVDRYPIRGQSKEYPAASIRQIPGAFERNTHRVAGRALTLDGIETGPLAAFRDPRVYLALGRGAIGSGRLRSEAYDGDRLETQLSAVAAEFPTHAELFRIDRATDTVSATPILSWRQADFVGAYADSAPEIFASRSPIERAIVAFAEPNLLPAEREYLRRNTFRVTFHDFDWRLNDLSGGARR